MTSPHPDYDPSWGVGVPGSDAQASWGSQDPDTPERPGDGDSGRAKAVDETLRWVNKGGPISVTTVRAAMRDLMAERDALRATVARVEAEIENKADHDFIGIGRLRRLIRGEVKARRRERMSKA